MPSRSLRHFAGREFPAEFVALLGQALRAGLGEHGPGRAGFALCRFEVALFAEHAREPAARLRRGESAFPPSVAPSFSTLSE